MSFEEEEFQLFASLFRKLDLNRDNYIDSNDMKRALLQLGKRASPDTIRDIIWEVDKDGDGKLSFDEIIAIFLRVRANPLSSEPTRLLNILEFLMHDTEERGTITVEQAILIMSRRFSREITQADLHHFVIDQASTTDPAKTRISFSEFLRQMDIARMLRQTCA
ncbi:putative outer dynein arm docking complex 3 [Paratrimastix pyriformis]|uniref:Outer dynein arm docking complex 3 n=1 Tax=Paratrimastix pyriformis TaxID=342808 RepID=A0ABQ8U7K7_9EUKA|nr:putative outer dynein arm docking complex 3 [Paratrimastix pyriformis]